MKADKAKMFSIPLNTLSVDDGAPFPLYIFLEKNNRYVPVCMPGDPIGTKKYENFLAQKHFELWIPESFQSIYKNYLEYLGKSPDAGASIHDLQPELPDAMDEFAAKTELDESIASEGPISDDSPPKSDEVLLVSSTIQDEDMSAEEKAHILSTISQDVLRALNQITTRGEAARAEGIQRCKEIANEVVNIASQNSNIYEEILALRNSQEDIEHSIITGSLSVMFGLACGISDQSLLADMTIACLFHDIGLVKVRPEILAKSESRWSAEEKAEYQQHPQLGIDILRESGSEFHPRVMRIIKEHHENYAGTGFPDGLSGNKIDDLSQIVHLSNLFDRLCNGKQTGEAVAPAEAFNFIYDISNDSNALQEIKPELVQQIFQFMLAEKEAADAAKNN